MSSPSAPLAAILGYDPELLRTLSRQHRHDLDSLSQAWLVSCVVLALPAGIAVWLVEHSILLSLLTALAALFLVLNLLRLTNSGSGTAPELPLNGDYRPSPLPVALLFGLALMMSQPAQLLRASESVHAAVEQHRSLLIASHRAAQEAMENSSGKPNTNEDEFLTRLEKCEFVVLRLQLLWSAPKSAVLWTALFVALVLLPAALTEVLWLDATATYERARYRRTALISSEITRLADLEVERVLGSFPTYRRPWAFPLCPPPPPEETRAESHPRDPSAGGAS